jgi:hypothetical protein
MTSANKIFYSIVAAKLLAIGLVFIAAISQSKLNTQAINATTQQLNAKQSVTNNTPYSSHQIQTVVISTHRLTMEEKLAMDMDHARTMQANAQFNKAIRKTV